MRLRITAAVTTGVVLIGILAWPLAAPPDPFDVVSLFAGSITLAGAAALTALAVLAGLIAYLVSWPYGREIGILAVPSGLAAWAIRGGSMANLMQQTPAAQRHALLAVLKWEPVFWLGIVAAGFIGLLIGQRIRPRPQVPKTTRNPNSNLATYLSAGVALVGSVLAGQLCIAILAQDVRFGSVVGQPAAGQIVFAVSVSFGVAAYVIKRTLNVGYIWPVIGSALITAFAITTYAKQDILSQLVEHWPAAFFSNAAVSILPVQMVAFGTLGSITGYWLAVRHKTPAENRH